MREKAAYVCAKAPSLSEGDFKKIIERKNGMSKPISMAGD